MKTLTLAATLVLAGPAAALAQALPSAESLHEKYIAAAGGREAMAAQTARTVFARIEVVGQGMGGPITLQSAAPNKLYTRGELGGLGTVESGYDGETAWSINPMMGPMLLDGLALEQMRQQADFHATLHPERHIESKETVAGETFEGKAAWKVKVRTKWGEEYHEYYDQESGLMIGAARKTGSPMGDLDAVTVLSGYKVMGGLAMPTVTTLKVMGIEQVIRVDSVSTTPIPDSVFALPAAIRALKK